MNSRKLRGAWNAWAIAMLLLACPCVGQVRYDLSAPGSRDIGRGINFYSPERERLVGQQLARRFESEQQILHDPLVDTCLRRIVGKLVAASDARPQLTVRVIEGDDVSAFAFPGGFIYLTTGVVLAADNEAQMAAVLAHEIAHVEARHATRNDSRARLTDALFAPLNFVPGPVGYPLHRLRARLLLRSAASAEREADVLGLEYLSAAGYDVREFARLLKNLERQGSPACAGFAFPNCRDRIARLDRAVPRFLSPREVNLTDTAEFRNVRTHLMLRTTVSGSATASAGR